MSLKDRDKESRLDVKTSTGLQTIAWSVPQPAFVESRRKALEGLQQLLRRHSSLCSGDVSLWSTGPSALTQWSRDFDEIGSIQQQQPEELQVERASSRSSSATSNQVPSYVKVRSVSMVGLWISIYVRADLRRLINSKLSAVRSCMSLAHLSPTGDFLFLGAGILIAEKVFSHHLVLFLLFLLCRCGCDNCKSGDEGERGQQSTHCVLHGGILLSISDL